jgi:hypothetical protein
MYAKKHNIPGGFLVAACDSELLGKKLRDGPRVLDLDAHAHFYKGELVGEEALIGMLKGAASANLVGRRAASCAVAAGLAKKKDIGKIAGVEHLQIYHI